jgi:hypothetical protein
MGVQNLGGPKSTGDGWNRRRLWACALALPLMAQACSSDAPAPRASPYETGMKLKSEGHCDQAVPLLEPVAAQGRGFEVAQYQVGLCLLDLGRNAATPAERSELEAKAARWILLAGNSGLGAAQEQLSRLSLDGVGLPADKIEAGKWALLFRHNPMRLQIGPRDLDRQLDKRLQEALSADDWVAATARADGWSPVIQELGPAAPEPSARPPRPRS